MISDQLSSNARIILRESVGSFAELFVTIEEIAVEAGAMVRAGRTDGGMIAPTCVEDIGGFVRDRLARHAASAAGMGIVVAPRHVDGGVGCIHWLWHNGDGVPTRLLVNLDPADTSYFDYTSTPWFRAAERGESRAATGPYIDYICSNEFVVTLTVPVYVDQRFYGVAAADVRADAIERLLVARLGGFSVPLVVVNAEFQVISSNDPARVAGDRIARRVLGTTLAQDAELGWSVRCLRCR
ncbi:MAG: hypothetical protein QM673_05575 [Gordonia sp. (in: high G+C Gram-positive bacteria)]